MKIRSYDIPSFFIDSLPDISTSQSRELLRRVEINAGAPDIFVWLNQLRLAPYSYDFIDNKRRKSPRYIIENLPPLKINTHFLLSFHILEFEDNSFIACRFCEPINTPLSIYLRGLFLEYRIVKQGDRSILWCKIKGYYNTDLSSRGFFIFFSAINKIMMNKQLKNLKKLSELTAAGKIEVRMYDLENYFIKSGIHWWIFCRRHNCKGLIT